MKITKATIKNFRLFKELILIEFEENFTSLVGRNGSGKTSILEAINLATSFYFVENKIREDDFNDDSRDIEITIEFDDFFFINIPDGWQTRKMPSRRIKFFAKHREKSTPGKAFSSPFVADHYVVPCEFTDRNELTIEDKKNIPKSVVKDGERFKFRRENDSEVEVSDQLLVVRNNLDNFPNVFYFSRNRDKDLRIGFFTTFQKIIDELNWRFFKKYSEVNERTMYISKWEDIYEYIISKVEDPKQSKIIHSLKENLKGVFGDKFDRFEISLLNLKQPFEKAFFALRDKDQIISLSNLASGELMVMAYYFLRLTSELSKEDVIFLIDDIELHLHPQLQYKLFEEVKSSKFQHILTTHSDVFVDLGNWKTIKRFGQLNIYPYRKLLSKRYGKSVGLEKKLRGHLDDIEILCQDKTIFRREDNEILFSEKCLLVEGPNDKYGLLDLAKKLKYDFSKLTVRYCTGKNNIHFYQTICLAYGIDYFVVYDQDGQGKNDLIEELVVNDNIFSFQNSFEKLMDSDKLYEILDKINKASTNDIPEEIKNCLSKIDKFLKD